MSSTATDVVGVVLAAGRGSRLSPITDFVPKPLLTVDNERLLDLALARLGAVVADVAVNAHHLAEKIADAATAFRPSVHVSFERERLLGTAGALRHLRDWIDGRPVLVNNSDLWLSDPIDRFLDDWDRERPRLLVRDMGRPADFGTYRYMGVSTVPAKVAAALEYSPDGLYSAVWKDAYRRGELEFVELTGRSFDCGTPAEFLTANLSASGSSSVVAPDAQVLGDLDRCVILSGARVAAGERLVCAIRDRFGNTLTADPADVAS
ncbi:MobA-like NTP transferase domain-containing protein [Nakamurella panacisegetis]|uniref:MobA-like NTP transferase domain-containing protein n=1 Tax=Nakamurella panacisegetis TaxID=1090615 RepID=A0A1H0IPG6_9ACTN|nr:sugar phosphate nucleotidyltransferase [Nakamurella panacisegetis]SDO33210.1 MobA-like NTP transferase domain-containing protein [Nakamurella panacisegetis]